MSELVFVIALLGGSAGRQTSCYFELSCGTATTPDDVDV